MQAKFRQKHYRHEDKYLCTNGELQMLQTRLDVLMRRDSHAGSDGLYRIRSIYFDTPEDRYLYDNLAGLSDRKKWRIRIYNEDLSRISLECKERSGNLIHKEQCVISAQQLQQAVARRLDKMEVSELSSMRVWNRFVMDCRLQGLEPVTIVQYERRPFICEAGNVRVTFDRSVASGNAFDLFADTRLPVRPVMPPGQQLLEVKYDAFLPDYLQKALQLNNRQRTSYSKFALCRQYNLAGTSLHVR